MTVTRRLAAILAGDVAGYSRLIGADEEGTLARLKAHRGELIDPKIAEHRGRIVSPTAPQHVHSVTADFDEFGVSGEWSASPTQDRLPRPRDDGELFQPRNRSG
jgi:hypothetical protein